MRVVGGWKWVVGGGGLVMGHFSLSISAENARGCSQPPLNWAAFFCSLSCELDIPVDLLNLAS